MPTVDLNARSMRSLLCPPGKSEIVYWCKALPGFGLRIRATGARSWLVQARLKTGRTVRVTVGDPHTVPLALARERARELLAEIGLHGDPPARLRREREDAATTVRSVMERYIAFKQPRLRPASFADLQHYLLHLARSLHTSPMAGVTRQDVAILLDRAAEGRPIAANRLRANLHALWVWAVRSGIVAVNPVAQTFLPAVERARERVLNDRELATLWAATADGSDYSRIVRLLLLTGARREELAALRWPELTRNADGGMTWLLPSRRSKNAAPNERVLPPFVVTQLPMKRPGLDAVFGKGDSGFSGFSRAKLRLDVRSKLLEWRLHDLRRTFVTRLNDLRVEPHVVEALVGHVGFARKSVAGVYNKSNYSIQKREVLQLWCDYVARLVGESIVPPDEVC
jgi:integrase